MKTVFCPVKGDQINGADCLVICDIADGLIKPRVLPCDILWDEQQQAKCKQCKYHDDIKD